eukprot:g7109.t1
MRILQLRMDVDEFGEFLRTIGIEPMKHVLQECFDEFDEEESGEICFDAFYKVMRLLAQREGFSKTEELQQVLMYLGIPTTLAECQDVAEIVDLDDSGYVDFQEFLMCMRLFRDRELTELKQTLQERTSDERIGLGSLWKFLVFFRQREGLTRAEMMHTRQAFRKYASGEEDDDEAFREKQLVAQVDIDRSATLNILELMKLVRFIREKRTHELQAAIQMHDRSDTGALSEKEALAAFKELGCLRRRLSGQKCIHHVPSRVWKLRI